MTQDDYVVMKKVVKKKLIRELKECEKENQQLKKNRDKALKFIKENSYKKGDGTIMYDVDIQELENIIKGDSE